MDTNILLHHFEVLAQFVEDVEKFALPVVVIVPGAVVHELDGCVSPVACGCAVLVITFFLRWKAEKPK